MLPRPTAEPMADRMKSLRDEKVSLFTGAEGRADDEVLIPGLYFVPSLHESPAGHATPGAAGLHAPRSAPPVAPALTLGVLVPTLNAWPQNCLSLSSALSRTFGTSPHPKGSGRTSTEVPSSIPKRRS